MALERQACGLLFHSCATLDDWQLQDEDCSGWERLLGPDASAVFLENLLADRQTEAHAIVPLGGVKGLKDVGHHLRRDARTVVGESHLDAWRAIAGIHQTGTDGESPAAWRHFDSLARIVDQVDEHLLQPEGVGFGGRKGDIEVQLQPDVRLLHERSLQFEGPDYEHVDVGWFQLDPVRVGGSP